MGVYQAMPYCRLVCTWHDMKERGGQDAWVLDIYFTIYRCVMS